MIENARLTPGAGFQPVNSLLYFGMRLVPQALPRRLIAATLAMAVDVLHPTDGLSASIPAQPMSRIKETVAMLRDEGRTVIDPLLSERQIAEIRAYLKDKELIVPGGHRTRVENMKDGVRRAAYPLDVILRAPHLVALMNRQDVLEIATKYLSCRPTISGIGLHLSLPAVAGQSDVQLFHRDPDDWRFLKMFVYLTDVDDESGPHEYVLRSHLDSGRLRSRPYSDAEVLRRYGAHSIARITGPSGTTFIADTWGIHKGRAAEARPRIMFQVTYSILPVYKFKYRPQHLSSGERVDPYTNRLLIAQSDE